MQSGSWNENTYANTKIGTVAVKDIAKTKGKAEAVTVKSDGTVEIKAAAN